MSYRSHASRSSGCLAGAVCQALEERQMFAVWQIDDTFNTASALKVTQSGNTVSYVIRDRTTNQVTQSDSFNVSAGDEINIAMNDEDDTVDIGIAVGEKVSETLNVVIDAGSGNDTVDGGYGDDEIFGRDGNDDIDGYRGDDVIQGNNNNDVIHGSFGHDTLKGGNGLDTLYGDTGDDRLEGGDHVDVLIGGDGADTLNGGAGSGNDLSANLFHDVVTNDGDVDVWERDESVGTDVFFSDGSAVET